MIKRFGKCNKIHFVLVFSLLLTMQNLSAETKNNFIELQSGSNLGLINFSYGWIIADAHHLSLGLGYVPKLHNHHEILLLSFKYRFQGTTTYNLNRISPDMSFKPFNFGVTAIVANNNALFTRLTEPNQIPDDYYYPTGEHYLINYQPLLLVNDSLQIYVDFSIVDIGLINYIRNFDFYVDNYNYIGLEGVVNYGIGIRKTF